MSSPWPPSTKAVTSSTETLNSSARKKRKRAESSTPAMPTTLLRGQAGELLQRPDHRVERVGDADDEGVRGVLLEAGADRLHDLEVDAEEVVAAHAGLARHAGGDDDDVGAGDGGVVAGAGDLGVEPVDRAGLGQVERLALGHAVDDVEQDDVAEFLQRGQMGERAADLTGADQSNLLARHGISSALRPLVETAARHDAARPRMFFGSYPLNVPGDQAELLAQAAGFPPGPGRRGGIHVLYHEHGGAYGMRRAAKGEGIWTAKLQNM